MSKRIATLFACAFAAVLFAVPTTALAADGDSVYVGGVELTGSTAVPAYAVTSGGAVSTDGASAGSYNVKWDGTVLTLSGATITQGSHENAAIYYEEGDLAIVLEGDSLVAGPDIAEGGSLVSSRGICAYDGSVTISGNGRLSVAGGAVEAPWGMAYSYGIWADGDVEISGGAVAATGGRVTNGNGAGGSYGISANQNVLFSGGTVTVTGGDASTLSYGAYAALGSITFIDGKLAAASGEVGTQIQPQSHALYGYGGVVVIPQVGEMISVSAGMTSGDAIELDGSPFRGEAAITNAVDSERYVLIEAIEATALTYELQVQGGTGSGSYVEGARVTISADEFNDHAHFAGWIVADSSSVDIENEHSAETMLTMPARNVSIYASYEDHALVHHDAQAPTCTESGWKEYVTCEGCAYTTFEEIPATGHAYEGGACIYCGERELGFQEPEQPGDSEEPLEPRDSEASSSTIPATGDTSSLLAVASTLVGVPAVAIGAFMRRRS